jgi:hypothetical protein
MTDTARRGRIGLDFRGALTRQSVESPPDEQPAPPRPPYAQPAVPPEPVDTTTLGERLRAAQKGVAEAPPPAAEQPAAEQLAADEPAEPTVVYEKKSRGLLIFTAIMVALTAGVLLGQTSVAEQGLGSVTSRLDPAGDGYVTPPAAGPSAAGPSAAGPSAAGPSAAGPAPGTRVTAPLAGATSHRFEVGGGADLISLRSADLGDKLYDITTFDGSAVPQIVDGGSRLELVRTGAPGRVGADIQLNSRVKWSLRLDGGTTEQNIDLGTGRLTRLELTGGATRVLLRLPRPKGTVPIIVTGPASEFDVQAGVPVRVRLGAGADDATIIDKTRHAVKAGTVVASAGWTGTTNRYDIKAAAKLNLLRLSAIPRVPPSVPRSSGHSAPPIPSASTASTAARPGAARG